MLKGILTRFDKRWICCLIGAMLCVGLSYADSPGHSPPTLPPPSEEDPCTPSGDSMNGGCGSGNSSCKPCDTDDECEEGEKGDPVRLSNGEFYYTRSFLSQKEGAFPSALNLRYSTKAQRYSSAGWGWAHNFNQRLYETDQGRIVIRDGHGKKRVFKPYPVGQNLQFIAISNNLDRIEIQADGSYQMHSVKQHYLWDFDTEGRLVSVRKENGGSWRLSYTSEHKEAVRIVPIRSNISSPQVVIRDWKVSRVQEQQNGQATGRFFQFNYNTTTGLLNSVVDQTGDKLELVHDSTYGYLLSINSPGEAQDVYTYNTSGRRYSNPYSLMETFSNTACTSCSVRRNYYDSLGRVTRQVQGLKGEGEDLTIDYTGMSGTNPYAEITFTLKQIVEDPSTGQFQGVDTGLKKRERVYFKINPYTNAKRVSRTVTQRGGSWDALDNIIDDYVKSFDSHDENLGELTQKTLRNGSTVTYTRAYHPNGEKSTQTEVMEVSEGVTQTTLTEYNNKGHMTRRFISQSDRPEESFETLMDYWEGTELLKETKRKKSTGVYLTTTNYYYNVGNGPSSVTAHTGLLAKSVTPLGHYTQYSYTEVDDATNPTSIGGFLASMSSHAASDIAGNSPLTSSSYTYDLNGNRLSSTVDGVTQYFEYDARQREIRSYTKDQDIILTDRHSIYEGYNLKETRIGNPVKGYRAVKFTYDSINNQIGSYRYTELLTDPLATADESKWEMLSEKIYRNDGKLTILYNALEQATTYTYDALGWLLSISTPVSENINSTNSMSYDRAGRIITRTVANGSIIHSSYDGLNRLAINRTVSDNTGSTAYSSYAHQYNALGQLVKLSIFEGADITGAAEATTHYYYDLLGRRVGINWNPENDDKTGDRALPSKSEYDANGRLVRRYDGEGRHVSFLYDGLDRAITTTVAQGTPDEARTSVRYTSQGRMDRSTDARGIHRYTHYDYLGRVTHSSIETTEDWNQASQWVNDANNLAVEIIEYSPWGEALQTLDIDRVTSTAEYDSFGRLLTSTRPGQPSLTYSYTALDYPSNITFPAIGAHPETTLSYRYDAANGSLLRSQTDRSGNTTAITYNSSLQRATFQSALNYPDGPVTSYSYDALNRLTSTVNALGERSALHYDIFGQVVKTYHPDHPYLNDQPDVTSTVGVESMLYDHYGQLSTSTGALQYPAKYSYDLSGNLQSLWDNKQQGESALFTGGSKTHWLYDNRNRVIRKYYDYGNGGSTRADYLAYTYNANSQITTRRNGRGKLTNYQYETSRNLLHSVDYADEAQVDLTYAYDKAHRQTSVSDATGLSSYVYDSLGRLTSYTQNSVNQTIHYIYDSWSRKTQRRVRPTGAEQGHADEWQTHYGYDAAGRLSGITDHRIDTTKKFTYNWKDQASLIGSIMLPTGANQTKTYDALGRLKAIRNFNQNSQKISSYDYTLNTLGQRTKVTRTGSAFTNDNTEDWSYNATGEIISADHSTNDAADRAYQFDVIGNRVKAADSLTLPDTANYTSNSLNQLTSIGANIRTHDADGNLTQDASKRYTWDEENRLIKVEAQAGTASQTPTTTYNYDSQSRRITKTLEAVTTHYLYEDWNLIAEYQSSQNSPQLTLSKTYTWGVDLSGSMQGAGGVGGLLAIRDSTGSYYPCYDGNGNITEYLNSTGDLVAHYEYDAFGRTVVQSGGKVDDFVHRFSTKPLEVETGLYYYGFRYYQPDTGRWLGRDPVEEAGGINLYGMVSNNPVNKVDVLGQFIFGIGAIAVHQQNKLNYAKALMEGDHCAEALAWNRLEAGVSILPELQMLDAMIPYPGGVGGKVLDAVMGPIIKGFAKAGLITGRVGLNFAKLAGRAGIRTARIAGRAGRSIAGRAGRSIAGYAGKVSKALAHAGGGRLNPFNYRVPAGELYMGMPRLVAKSSKAPKTTGNTVIGHLGTKPNYVDVAKEVGANYLVPSKNWNFKKQGEFIQGVIKRGDNVYIGTPIRPGPSILKKEIKQLIKAGYKPVEQGSKVLIKK